MFTSASVFLLPLCWSSRKSLFRYLLRLLNWNSSIKTHTHTYLNKHRNRSFWVHQWKVHRSTNNGATAGSGARLCSSHSATQVDRLAAERGALVAVFRLALLAATPLPGRSALQSYLSVRIGRKYPTPSPAEWTDPGWTLLATVIESYSSAVSSVSSVVSHSNHSAIFFACIFFYASQGHKRAGNLQHCANPLPVFWFTPRCTLNQNYPFAQSKQTLQGHRCEGNICGVILPEDKTVAAQELKCCCFCFWSVNATQLFRHITTNYTFRFYSVVFYF